MKFLKYVLAFCAVAGFFFLGLLLFAPWEAIGVYGMDLFRLRAAESGVYVQYDRFGENGGLFPAYRMGVFAVETPMARVSLSDVTVGILPFASLFSRGGVCQIGFTGGTITLVPNNELGLGAGRVKLAAAGETFRASDAQLTGDVRLSGDMTYNLQTKKMIESSIVFTVPEPIGAMLRNPMLARFIEPNEQGEWRIRYEAQNQ